jgi:L-glyceraldehyde 3-phosphate reductase
MGALAQAVRQGKALYAGLSNYPADITRAANEILRSMGVPCLIQQPRYNMFERTPEKGLIDVCDAAGIGIIAYMPLAQGMLTDRYTQGIPPDSRAASQRTGFTAEQVTAKTIATVKALRDIALERGQSLAQMAIAWSLRDKRISSSLLGASRPEHIRENIEAVKKTEFSPEELEKIDRILIQATEG